MKNSILKWLCMAVAEECGYRPGRRESKAVNRLEKLEEQLGDSFSEEQAEWFREYREIGISMGLDEEVRQFSRGFRLAFLLCAEAMSGPERSL